MRLSTSALAAGIGCVLSLAGIFGGTAGAAVVDHYTQGPGGTTITTRTDEYGNPVFGTLSTAIPFDWTVDFDSNLRGRDMTSSDGVFCQRIRSDYVQSPTLATFMSVHLIRNVTLGSDVDLGNHHFALDGGLHAYCFPTASSSSTYHYDYRLPTAAYGSNVQAHGTAYH